VIDELHLALEFLGAQSTEALVQLYWFTLVLEIPRYACGFLAVGLAAVSIGRNVASACQISPIDCPSVSVIVVGHNEARALQRCLSSLQEQTRQPTEVIVVSDGSSDGMAALATRLVGRGLAQHALATDLRGGKSAGFNLGLRKCTGDIIVNVDCDCSYDRFALERLTAPFSDPKVGAVSGDIALRNGSESLITRMQQVEYLLSISLGRRVAVALRQVSCVSGAFGAYRRTALEQIGGCDIGGGEDLDLTLRLRAAGWRIAFAPDATCYTEVPARLSTLVRQRLRWERDSIRLRCRKHRRSVLGSDSRWIIAEAAHQWDFLIFEFGAAVVFPFYLMWLSLQYGSLALPILIAMQFGLIPLDIAMVALASLISQRTVPMSLLLYSPGYSVYSAWMMRPVRLLAFIQEWFLFGSMRDNYVPAKVRQIRKW
jgi:cellulose synthase/poly-beta-1,6-N-acetylglucosamine synthase-like glycosyltransferase